VGCNTRFYTPRATLTPTRVAVAFRTAHLHSGPIARAKFRCAFNAPIIARGKFFDLIGPPEIYMVGVGPRRALQFCSTLWFGQAKKAVANKKAAEEAEKVRSSLHWMDSISVALRATRAHALSGDIFFIHTRVL
jgi:hypothetical protein